MQQEIATPVDLKVLMNHIYEYKKGVRRLVLYTFNKKYESFAITRLERQNIDYIIQPVGNDRLNLFFGKKERMSGCYPHDNHQTVVPAYAGGGFHLGCHAGI